MQGATQMQSSKAMVLLVLGLGSSSAWSYDFTTLSAPFPCATFTEATGINNSGLRGLSVNVAENRR